jgi:hypothetical protein
MESDRLYYARRAAEQRRAAEAARDADTRRRHLELARLLNNRSDRPS